MDGAEPDAALVRGHLPGHEPTHPESDGEVGYPLRLDGHTTNLVFWVTGLYDENGDPHPTGWEGLEANLDEIEASVTGPVETGDGTRPCTLTMPSGATRTADVQFQPLRRTRPIEDAELVEFVLSMRIVSGRFT